MTSPVVPAVANSTLSAAAEKPSKLQRFSNLWTLYYRHGMNATLTKNFYCDGNLQIAIKRAQLHCQVMNYKYIWVRPLICDIDAEEEYKLKGGSPDEGY